jgi:hypothetical protein
MGKYYTSESSYNLEVSSCEALIAQSVQSHFTGNRKRGFIEIITLDTIAIYLGRS